MQKQLRLRLILGKFPVSAITKTLTGWQIELTLGGTTTAKFIVPHSADVRQGDILTLYTEVLSNRSIGIANANISQPPI